LSKAQTYTDQIKKELSTWLAVNAKNWYIEQNMEPIVLKIMQIAILEGDIDKAIMNLKIATENNYIVTFGVKVEPMYKQLKQHPEWPAILEGSNLRAAAQREIYFELLAKQG
jgi:hypothetical protein